MTTTRSGRPAAWYGPPWIFTIIASGYRFFTASRILPTSAVSGCPMRPLRESNPATRLCRPLPNRSGKGPSNEAPLGATGPRCYLVSVKSPGVVLSRGAPKRLSVSTTTRSTRPSGLNPTSEVDVRQRQGLRPALAGELDRSAHLLHTLVRDRTAARGELLHGLSSRLRGR